MVEQNRESQTQTQLPDWKPNRDSHRTGNKAGQTSKRLPNFLRHRKQPISKGPHKHGSVFLFFGVILPLIAIVFELTTHFCAQHFFDPFPSANHVILFMLIPLSNLMAWLSGRRDMSAHFGFMSLISGMAMGIGCLYALMFLPLTPHSAMYTLLFGFGLLGFAPLLSVPCTWLSGKTVCKLAASRRTFFDPHQVEHIGHLIVLCLVVAVELPSTLTRVNLGLAADPGTEKQGVQWLRQFGSEEVMLRACYERSGRATDILGSLYESGHPLSIESARSIFYKVTGKPFNSVPIPSAARATIQHAGLVDDPNGFNAGVTDEFDLDSDIAGENVSGVARGLSVSDSSVRVVVEPNSAVADLDWSATFTNVSPYDREARAKLVLPADGVVTKATVTVNGVERDATILVRSLARSIYKQSVIDHKDPLLVSTCGVNQVLIQCFPVQPNSSMIVRLKIAAPLVLSADKKSGALMLPAFEERNFQFDRPVNVRIASDNKIVAPVAKLIDDNDSDRSAQPFHAAFEVEPSQIARFGAVVKFERNPDITEVISNPKSGKTGIAARAILPAYKSPAKLAILIDGSAPMQRYIPELAAALKSLPAAVRADIIVVGDDVEELGNNGDASKYATALSALEKYHAAGGHADDSQLLIRLTASPVLWIHGAQPINSADPKLLTALLQRPTDTPWLYDVQTVSGPNEFLNGLEPNANFVSVPRVGKLEDDLKRLFSSWTASSPKSSDNLRFADWTSSGDEKVDSDKVDAAKSVAAKPGTTVSDAGKSGSAKPSAHQLQLGDRSVPALVQLYGYQKLLQSYQSTDKTPALMLAEKYHLVSPVSSAVVMEYVPALHPSPVQAGTPVQSGWLADLMAAHFKSVTAQLNNLSAASSSSDGPIVDDKRAYSHDAASYSKSAQTSSRPAARWEFAPSQWRRSAGSSEEVDALKEKSGDGNFLLDWAGAPSSRNDKDSVSAAKPDYAGNLRNKNESAEAPPPMPARANAPSLQGATNGTVGPRDVSIVDEEREVAKQKAPSEPEPMYSRSAPQMVTPALQSAAPELSAQESPAPASPGPNLNPSSWLGALRVQPQMEERAQRVQELQELKAKGGGSDAFSSGSTGLSQPWNPFDISAQKKTLHAGGLVGAPLDPRYGQSNSVRDTNTAPPWGSGLRSALSIFILVFMSIYAFFKLLKAMSRSKSNK